MLQNKNYILLYVLILFFLFIPNCFSQKELIDKLKIIELSIATTTFDSLVIENKSSINQSISFELNTKINNLIQFISNQKRDSETSFDTTIKPFLIEQLAEINNQSINFNEQEELVFESFARELNWDTTLQRLKVYENFIDENFKDSTQVKNLISVLSTMYYLHFYVHSKQENQIVKNISICLKENFKEYNAVNWKVFALNPTAIILWTIATCTWDTTLKNNFINLTDNNK